MHSQHKSLINVQIKKSSEIFNIYRKKRKKMTSVLDNESPCFRDYETFQVNDFCRGTISGGLAALEFCRARVVGATMRKFDKLRPLFALSTHQDEGD